MSSFFNATEAGEDLLSVVETLGENIYFLKADGERIDCKMCFDDGIRPSQSTVDRTFRFIGEMTFPSRDSMRELCGQYFYKENEPLKTFMLVAAIPNPFSDKFANVDLVECNETINIGYFETTLNAIRDPETKFVSKYENVKVFAKTELLQPYETSGGDLRRSRTTMYLPSYAMTTSDDFIERDEIKAYADDLTKNYIGKQMFSIIDCDISMATDKTEDTISGVIVITVELKV